MEATYHHPSLYPPLHSLKTINRQALSKIIHSVKRFTVNYNSEVFFFFFLKQSIAHDLTKLAGLICIHLVDEKATSYHQQK